ncbi:MAG: glucokinase [Deltaproteobacteria bacterium]
MFVSILGAEAGNLALRMMASGGIYIGGGIPPRIISALQSQYQTCRTAVTGY